MINSYRFAGATASLKYFELYDDDSPDATESCEFGGYFFGQDRWFFGTGDQPQVGDTVYTNSAGTITFNGGSSWWYHDLPAPSSTYRINSSGVVLATSICG